MRESIDELENFDTSNILNSPIIMPMPSKNNPPDGYMRITSPIDPAIIPKRICVFNFKL